MSTRLVTLTTDFGSGSYYVSQMKGAIFLRNPDAQVIDLSHDLPPHDIPAAAYWLNRATRLFPSDTIHVVVIDPGVGTSRELVYCRTTARTFLAPDNGVLSAAAQQDGIAQIVRLSNSQLFHADISQTFHGRDILAPVAAKLSLGASPLMLGEPLRHLQEIRFPVPRAESDRLVGEIVFVDRFGNLISNITRDHVERFEPASDLVVVTACGKEIRGLCRTYGDAAPGETIAIFDSDGFLEVAVVNASAAEKLSAVRGDALQVRAVHSR